MELIDKLKHNIKYHIRPYNLGDGGETETLIMELIRQLEVAQQSSLSNGTAYFALDDTDDGNFYCLEVQFIENNVIMFTVINKEHKKETSVISVVYSDLVDGIANLSRPKSV